MTVRKIEIEIPEAELEKQILEVLNRRVQRALEGSKYLWAAEAKIQETAKDLLAEMDLRELVKPKIQESIDHFLEDSVRHQVRNLVRLAVQREIAAQRAELIPEETQT